MESLVVPDSEETKTLSSPINLLIRVDFPALGLPIIEILTSLLKVSDPSKSSSNSLIADRISSKPLL